MGTMLLYLIGTVGLAACAIQCEYARQRGRLGPFIWFAVAGFVFSLSLAVAGASICNAAGPHAMPPHPDMALRPVSVAAFDAMQARGLSLWELGRDEPSDFSMLRLLQRADRSLWSRAIDLVLGMDAPPAEFKMLVLLIDFGGEPATTPAAFFDSLCFGTDGHTCRTFYAGQSGGRLDLVAPKLPSAFGWVRLPQPLSYYTGGNYGLGAYPQNSQRMVEDALTALGDFDLSPYDNDGDGRPDLVSIVHAGPGAEFTGSSANIWSHKWQTRTGITYTTMPEYWQAPRDMTIGVFCHEWGHAFGLPDLYDTDGSSRGIGRWGLMSSGSWNGGLGSQPSGFCAWSRLQLGFSEAIDVAGAGDPLEITIGDVAAGGRVVRVWASGGPSPAYYLATLRLDQEWHDNAPWPGVLITAIDESGSNRYEWCWRDSIYGTGRNPLVRVVQADARCDLETNANGSDRTDIYEFDGQTFARPLTTWYTGDETFVRVALASVVADTATLVVQTCNCQSHGTMTFEQVAAVAFTSAHSPHSPTCAYADADVDCNGLVDVFDIIKTLRGLPRCAPCGGM